MSFGCVKCTLSPERTVLWRGWGLWPGPGPLLPLLPRPRPRLPMQIKHVWCTWFGRHTDWPFDQIWHTPTCPNSVGIFLGWVCPNGVKLLLVCSGCMKLLNTTVIIHSYVKDSEYAVEWSWMWSARKIIVYISEKKPCFINNYYPEESGGITV